MASNDALTKLANDLQESILNVRQCRNDVNLLQFPLSQLDTAKEIQDLHFQILERLTTAKRLTTGLVVQQDPANT